MIFHRLRNFKHQEHLLRMRSKDIRILVQTSLESMMVEYNSMMTQVRLKKYKIYKIAETNQCQTLD